MLGLSWGWIGVRGEKTWGKWEGEGRKGGNEKRTHPKAAAKPMALTCKCLGNSFVATTTAAGNMGARKNPLHH